MKFWALVSRHEYSLFRQESEKEDHGEHERSKMRNILPNTSIATFLKSVGTRKLVVSDVEPAANAAETSVWIRVPEGACVRLWLTPMGNAQDQCQVQNQTLPQTIQETNGLVDKAKSFCSIM